MGLDGDPYFLFSFLFLALSLKLFFFLLSFFLSFFFSTTEIINHIFTNLYQFDSAFLFIMFLLQIMF